MKSMKKITAVTAAVGISFSIMPNGLAYSDTFGIAKRANVFRTSAEPDTADKTDKTDNIVMPDEMKPENVPGFEEDSDVPEIEQPNNTAKTDDKDEDNSIGQDTKKDETDSFTDVIHRHSGGGRRVTPTPAATEEPAELQEISIDNWSEGLKDGDKYDISVKMYRWPMVNPPSFSMGNGALTGNARLVKENGRIYAEIDFQAIDMGSTVGHLINFYSFAEQDKALNSETLAASGAANVSDFIDKFGTACEYGYDKKGYIKYARIPLEKLPEEVTAGLESDFTAMGKQLCVLNFDYTNAIEKITGQKIEKTKQADAPETDTILSADGKSFEISLRIPKSSEASDADIYYMISGSDNEDLTKLISDEHKYTGKFSISKEEADKIAGEDGTFNIYSVSVKEGFKNSAVNVKKMTFGKLVSPSPVPTASPSLSPDETAAPSAEPTATPKADNGKDSADDSPIAKDGKYTVKIALYNASSDQESMGDAAFKNNRIALITTKRGVSTISIASNPVSIPPYYSALSDVMFKNENKQWQRVKPVQTKKINASDGSKEYSMEYLELFEFILPSADDEYIPVKISVPYTPMDSVAVGGYIEARLYINWDSLRSASDDEVIEPDSSDARGSSSYSKEEKETDGEAVDTEDKETGIRITADKFVFPSNTAFKCTELKEGETYDSAKQLLEDEVKSFKLYSITAEADKETASQTGFAKLYFPIENEDKSQTVIYRITDNTAVSKAGKTQLEYEISEDGKYYVVSVKELGNFAIGEASKPIPTATPNPEEIVFTDIKGHKAEEIIKKAYEMGLFKGMDESHFAPDIYTTRGMFVTVLGRIKGIDTNRYVSEPFEDVNENDYFTPYSAWSNEESIMGGIDESHFAPEININREQLAEVLCNYALHESMVFDISEEKQIADLEKVSKSAVESVQLAINADFMQLDGEGRFNPQEPMTRAEIAETVVNFVE